MTHLRPPFVVVLVFAIGLLGGIVIESHVLSRIGSPVETVGGRPATEGKENSAAEKPGYGDGYPGNGGFGSAFGEGFPPTGFSFTSDTDYWLYRDPDSVWVEVRFIEIATADLDTITIDDATTSLPANEKLLLTAKERTQLLHALKSTPSYRLLGRASGTTICGNQMLVQSVDELSYLVEKETERSEDSEGRMPDDKAGDGADPSDQGFYVTPMTIEAREIGVRLNFTPTVSNDGSVITIVMLPELSMLTGWVDPGGDRPHVPTFRSWNVSTTVYLAPGMSMLMPCSPALSARRPGAAPSDAPGQEETVLILITARLIELPDEPGDNGPPESPLPGNDATGKDTGERPEP
ncbi:MAG: hypothetical protein JW889_13645 [Verrucomicrobia bacterium]|nr:hypothetical protein [Verrucomicrobiota bacterium]